MIAHTEAEMIDLGRSITTDLSAGDIVALVGDLGAGKTHFTKGIVEGLGCDADVTSPTFALVNEYHGGKLPVYHFDFYRLDSIEELDQIGWEEYLDSDGILVVEWADKYPEALLDHTSWYRFSADGDTRTIEKA